MRAVVIDMPLGKKKPVKKEEKKPEEKKPEEKK